MTRDVSSPHSGAGSRVFSDSLGSPALERIGMGLDLCNQPECTNPDHLVGYLRQRVRSTEEQLEAAERERVLMKRVAQILWKFYLLPLPPEDHLFVRSVMDSGVSERAGNEAESHSLAGVPLTATPSARSETSNPAINHPAFLERNVGGYPPVMDDLLEEPDPAKSPS